MKTVVREMLLAGASYDAIVEKVGCSKPTITYHAKKLGLPSKWVHRLSNIDPSTRTAMCSTCGPVRLHVHNGDQWACSSGTRRYVRSKAGKPYSRSKQQKLHDHARKILTEAQAGACAVCGDTPNQLVIDHDHTTGLIRGALCTQCNSGIGMLRDDPALLQKAIAYLGRSATDRPWENLGKSVPSPSRLRKQSRLTRRAKASI